MELDFLVESGLGFGFVLGLGQMIAWVMNPKPWTLPVSVIFDLNDDVVLFPQLTCIGGR